MIYFNWMCGYDRFFLHPFSLFPEFIIKIRAYLIGFLFFFLQEFWSSNVVKSELKFHNRQIQIAYQATCFDFSPNGNPVWKFPIEESLSKFVMRNFNFTYLFNILKNWFHDINLCTHFGFSFMIASVSFFLFNGFEVLKCVN